MLDLLVGPADKPHRLLRYLVAVERLDPQFVFILMRNVNDGLVLIGKFNSNLQDGMPFNEALYEASKSRFRAIFLTSLTTVAGLGPLILETSRQAQFLIPMAISIAYGIGVATFLTLIILPIYLSLANSFKVNVRWLFTGKKVPREEVEQAFIELKAENYE